MTALETARRRRLSASALIAAAALGPLLIGSALYLQRAFLARRSYVTLSGKGSRPQLTPIGPFRWLLPAHSTSRRMGIVCS